MIKLLASSVVITAMLTLSGCATDTTAKQATASEPSQAAGTQVYGSVSTGIDNGSSNKTSSKTTVGITNKP